MRRTVLFGLTVLAAALAARLGVWQLSRYQERKTYNQEARVLRVMPELDPNAGGEFQPNRRAVLRGEYDESNEFLLRGRSVQGIPAVQVVSPIRMAGRDTAVLVNRGYVPAPDAVDPGDATWSEPGRVEVHGILLPVPDRGDGNPLVHNGRESWQALDLSAMRERLSFPVAPLYLLAEADSGDIQHTARGRTYPIRASAPELSGGPHLSYAIQWFGIGLAALAFGVFFVLRRTTPRRVE